MPELAVQSTPPPPDASPLPPALDPSAFEDFPVFRETFLLYVTEPHFAAALREVGEWLFAMVLECYGEWPPWRESATRTELRAALADARHLEGFLASVGREHDLSSLSFEDIALSQFAERQAREVARIADRIEEELGEWAQ
jgi:hypothetical protein